MPSGREKYEGVAIGDTFFAIARRWPLWPLWCSPLCVPIDLPLESLIEIPFSIRSLVLYRNRKLTPQNELF
ncbi:hypothetical protein SAMN05660652_00667 [Propionivibrio dicarboxylicus]|uniref:Uncharacterized protein n=1 Tax=Propionivibrio dicarboxylicus TaxID=83767 RepID=A0A1G7WXH3_9RHOO|nr:hypothetical protein SAMN05660652_00667 [Propionivibrio dicarboxylicus]